MDINTYKQKLEKKISELKEELAYINTHGNQSGAEEFKLSMLVHGMRLATVSGGMLDVVNLDTSVVIMDGSTVVTGYTENLINLVHPRLSILKVFYVKLDESVCLHAFNDKRVELSELLQYVNSLGYLLFAAQSQLSTSREYVYSTISALSPLKGVLEFDSSIIEKEISRANNAMSTLVGELEELKQGALLALWKLGSGKNKID